MMDFLTEEEEFELLYEDELDAINDMEPIKPVEADFYACDSYTIYSESEKRREFDISEKQKRNGISRNGVSPGLVDCILEGSEEPHTVNSESQSLLYSQPCSENFNHSEKNILTPSKTKRNISEVCVSPETGKQAKRKRFSPSSCSAAVKEFLKDKAKTQATSLFGEASHRFLSEQLPMTNFIGRRIYFNVRKEDDENDDIPSFSQKTCSLLPVPIDVLKTQCLLMEENSQRASVIIERETEHAVLPAEVAVETENSLWVEKYRPLSYMHLLSEEGINRTLLHWLKLWDKAVFGKDYKRSRKSVDPKKKNKFHKSFGELIEDLDEHGRPYHKVALLCGPPGLGKTTLAIIIAKHVGYNVVEINASDDRNPEAFRTNLEAATQMKSVLDQDHRPNCLILDEIDGAPAPSINVLLQFIKSTGVTKGKRKKGDIPLLMRPIICICNDQFSPALKPLRQVAVMLNFGPTSTNRLLTRLNEVIIREGLRADLDAISILCEKTGNDIRSCLSTLQFFHRQRKALKASDLSQLHIGEKDMHKGLFTVWQEIFQLSAKSTHSDVLHTVQAFGDYDRIFIGMFENYLGIKFKDRTLKNLWKGPDWLCFADIIQQQIAHHQLYFLLPYLPYSSVAFHLLYATHLFPHVSYPAAYYEHRAKLTQLTNTLGSMTKDIVSLLKIFLDPTTLVGDIFPFLEEIVKPSLRPVNTHLYSEQEKQELQRVIDLMLGFNLSYRQERSQDGAYNYVLEPNIEELNHFTGLKSKRILTYAAKQLIAREVDVARMRKDDTMGSVVEGNTESQSQNTIQEEKKKKEKERKLPVAEKPTLDFFGRRIPEKEKPISGNPELKDDEIWFHFKEGYTNAVRRPVFIKNLM